ncbi:MAG TPA: transglycosylase family protein, partial [Candidatus Limnocylindrales bacterium]
MPDLLGRRRAAVVAVAATTLLLALIPAGTVAKDPPRLADFMHGIAQVESGGRYTARNATTGAYGKYQIMPRNWRAWARLYLGNAAARPTPANQERVAKAKFTALWGWLHDWRVVAHWWLTGSKDPNPAHWTPFSRRYVNNVIALMGKAPPVATPPVVTPPPVTAPPSSPPPVVTPPPVTPPVVTPPLPAPALHVYQETSPKIAYSGIWSAARATGYAGGAVRYARTAGATAQIAFVGTGVRWMGPVGP